MEAIRRGDIPGVQLRRRIVIAGCSAAEVWPYLVETAAQCRWLADRSSSEPGPPKVFRFETNDAPGSRSEYAEVFEEIETRRLVLGFRELDAGWKSATRLTIELTEGDSDCEVMVFQEGFQQLPLSIGLTAWEAARARWGRSLERLTRVLAG